MSSPALPDDLLLALVHEIRTHLRRGEPLPDTEDPRLAALEAPVVQQVRGMVSVHRDLELFLGRLSDYASACYLSKARPLPLHVALQCAMLQFPAQRIECSGVLPELAQRRVPVEMVRSFRELLDNAIKFSKGAPVHVSILEEDRHCAIVISDLGVGIPGHLRENVFGLLVRMHSRDDYPGFGLGLPIARRICEAAGASVSFRDKPGGGLEAVVRLPLG